MTETVQLDGATVEIVETRPMGGEIIPRPQTTVDIADQTKAGTARFRERVEGAREQLRLALKLTQPGQWIVMDGGQGKQTVYATAGAADRILRMGFGMRWGEKRVHVEETEDAIEVTATAPLLTPDDTVYEIFTGTRRGAYDPNSAGGIKGYLKNRPDLIKGALANMAHQAVTQILGLRFLTPQDFRELGLDLDKLTRRAEFQDRSDQGDAGAALVPFGKNKGTPVTDLTDRSLDWYIGAAEKNVADPGKAKWRDREQRWLDALLAEKNSRAGGGAPGKFDDVGPAPMTDEEQEY